MGFCVEHLCRAFVWGFVQGFVWSICVVFCAGHLCRIFVWDFMWGFCTGICVGFFVDLL